MRRFHFPLFLLSLTIAVVVKLAVSETDQVTERTVEARVSYQLPIGVLLTDRTKSVEVRLQGRRNELADLNPLFVEVDAAIGQGQLGQVSVVLQRDDVRAPASFEVVGIEPSVFNVQVEPKATAVLPVQVELIGEPAAGARPGEPTVRPAWAEAVGPAQRIRAMTHLRAQVSVERKAISFETVVPIAIDDPNIEVQPARVTVLVPLSVPEPIQQGELPPESAPAPERRGG